MSKRKLWVGMVVAVPLACGQVAEDAADSVEGGSANVSGRASVLGGANTMGGRASGGVADRGGRAGANAGGATSGSAGTGSDGGISGSAGCDAGEIPVVDFSKCKNGPLMLGGSTCDPEATRRALGCGDPGSSFNEACCTRTTCRDNGDCEAGAECIPKLVQVPTFSGSLVESCEGSCDGSCSCSGTDDIDMQGYCVSRDEDLARFDCDTRGRPCAELEQWRYNLTSLLDLSRDDVTPTGATAYASRTIACAEKLDRELRDACGVSAQCECSASVCSMALEDFHPFDSVLGRPITFEGMKAAPLLCPRLTGGLTYQECADGVATFVLSEQEGTSGYFLSFQNKQFVYGLGIGSVPALCPSQTPASPNVVAGTRARETSCHYCQVCPSTADGSSAGSGGGDDEGRGGGGGDGGTTGGGGTRIPACAYNRFGEITIPAP